jgi:hypothetical protein
MLSYSHAVVQSCCRTVMLSYSHAVVQSCCRTVMLSCCPGTAIRREGHGDSVKFQNNLQLSLICTVLTRVLVVQVLVLRVRDVHRDFRLFGRLVPLEKEAESNVVRIGGKLPEERSALVVRGNSDRHRFAVTNLE